MFTKRIFLLFAIIAAGFLCHANDTTSYDDEDKEESKQQISPKKQKRINKLQQEIKQLEQEIRSLKRHVPGNIKTINRLICYIHCVKMAPVTCRVQMGPHRVKTIPGGTYYVSCPNKCNYPNYPDNLIYARHRHRGCVHYDTRGYWFVTYICNAHRYQWHFDLVKRYQQIYRQYPGFESYKSRYYECIKELKRKQTELKKLLPPPPPKNNDNDDDQDDDDDKPQPPQNNTRQNQNDNDTLRESDNDRQTYDDDRGKRGGKKIVRIYGGNAKIAGTRTKKFITLHMGLNECAVFSLHDENQFLVTSGKQEIGISKSLASKFPSLYFNQPTCLAYSMSGQKVVWELKNILTLNFSAEKISGVEILKTSRSGVSAYKVTTKNSKQIYDKDKDKVLLFDTRLSVMDMSPGTAEYKIRVYFE